MNTAIDPQLGLSAARGQKRGIGLENKQVVVLGAGRSGVAAAKLAKAAGAKVRLLEKTKTAPDLKTQKALATAGIALEQGSHCAGQFQNADLLVLSPGIARREICALLPAGGSLPVYSELEVASWFLDESMIAVTGSNGKTTTVSLMAQVCEAAGQTVFLGGNIGTPLSDYIVNWPRAERVILEVSSFQLEHTWTFHPDIAVLLNFHANHLDYHESLDAYWRAKMKIFANQGEKDTAILPVDQKSALEQCREIRARKHYFQGTSRLSCPNLAGAHNQANIHAAVLACQCCGIPPEQAAEAVQAYQGLPHRLQPVDAIKGVRFVNDSKATTTEAQEAALKSFQEPVLLLAGGRFKGGSPQRLRELMAERVKVAGLFGESREIFETAWGGAVPMYWEPTLEQAFQKIVSLARPGDVVLLSPGTSSFDLFENYEHRGQTFIDLVKEIAGARSV